MQDNNLRIEQPAVESSGGALSASDEALLRRAIALARAAVVKGNHPFGAVVIARPRHDDGASSGTNATLDPPIILVEAENTVNTEHDPTGHAETNAIRALGAALHKSSGCISSKTHSLELFTSTEPCVMCSGAVYWSFAVERVVYACSEKGLGKFAGADFLCPSRETFARGSRRVVVEGPFLEDEAEAVHAEYWPSL